MSQQDIWIVTSLVVVALFVGWLVGAVGWCLFGASLVWIGLQQRELNRLLAWVKRPLARPHSQLDSWDTATYQAYQALRRERGRSRDLLQRLRGLVRMGQAIPDAAIIVGEWRD